jgi:lipid II:glycine glycyltransferase (peptidoglycan interpeptide bridge formation enzyme)
MRKLVPLQRAKCTNKEEKCLTKPISEVKSMFKENITEKEAKFILNTAKSDINIIKEKYALSQNVSKIDIIVGWIVIAIKEDYQILKVKKRVAVLMIMNKEIIILMS